MGWSIKVLKKSEISIITERPYNQIYDLGGGVHYVPLPTRTVINCELLSDKPIDSRYFKEVIMSTTPEILEQIATSIEEFPHSGDMYGMSIDGDGNIVSLRTLYLQILPELNRIRERKAYETDIDNFLKND